MTKYTTDSGVIIVDDTSNSNPESIAGALSYIKIYKKRRFFVLQPMIELGKNAKTHHYRIGIALSAVCDRVFLTNKNYLKEINRGIHEGKGRCVVVSGSLKKIKNELLQRVETGDVVVCEGNEAKPIVDHLLS